MTADRMTEELVSPHGFDGFGPVPDEVMKGARRVAMLRVKFLTTESGLTTREIEDLFYASALTAEWLREVYEARDVLRAPQTSSLGIPVCKKGTPHTYCEAAATCPCDEEGT